MQVLSSLPPVESAMDPLLWGAAATYRVGFPVSVNPV